MAINPHNRGPLRTLSVLALLILGLYGLLGAVSTWGTGQLAPKLGLDLEGGTQLILAPKIVGDQKISEGQVQKAVDIIRARVDGSGVAEAEVTTQGTNIVISLPGTPDKATIASLQKSSQLRMRATLVEASGAPTPLPTSTGTATSKPTSPATSTPKATATGAASGTATTAPKSGFPPALTAATTPAPSASAAPSAAPTATAKPTTAAKPKNPSDLAWITPELEKTFTALNCADPKSVEAIVDDPAKPMVTCSSDGQVKYILGPAEVFGTEIKNATSGQKQTQSGSTGEYEVR
ncbi:MAG TPA: protein translocase subunit SecD, partial [Dermatophilaceae bacterium]|nr:protein translocase subunit SecD [Dermatophilaceae bacterium]